MSDQVVRAILRAIFNERERPTVRIAAVCFLLKHRA